MSQKKNNKNTLSIKRVSFSLGSELNNLNENKIRKMSRAPIEKV
jgi:hypothetical protein